MSFGGDDGSVRSNTNALSVKPKATEATARRVPSGLNESENTSAAFWGSPTFSRSFIVRTSRPVGTS